MPAIDTIASFQTTVNSTLAAGVMATGDSATVRNFPQPGAAYVLDAFYDYVTTPLVWRVRSPLLHDNIRGLQFWPGLTQPTETLLPHELPQPLQPQDNLIFEFSTAASTGKALGCLEIFYPSLPGVSARLHSLADIAGNVKSIKPMVVTIGSGANTAGIWLDTVATTTENILHANTDYAVLGITTDTAVACVAIKGIDTGNLRIGVPGNLNTILSQNWFIRLARETNLPVIPVINSANIGGIFVSIISSAATGAALDANVYLAELQHNLPN